MECPIMDRRYLALDIQTAKMLPDQDEDWAPLGIIYAASLASFQDSGRWSVADAQQEC